MGSSPDRVNSDTIKFIFVASLRRKRNTRGSGLCVRVWEHVYLPTDDSVRKDYKNPNKRVGLVQSESDHHLIEN